MQDSTSEIQADELVEQQELEEAPTEAAEVPVQAATEPAAPEQADDVEAEASAAETATAETTTAEEAPLPEGPPFDEQLRETLAMAQERLDVFLASLGETLAPVRERLGDKAWVYGVIGLAAILLIVALFVEPFSLLRRIGITGYTTLDAQNAFVCHPDKENADLTLSVAPSEFEGRLRVRLSEIPRDDALGFKNSKYRPAADALLETSPHLQPKSQLYLIGARGKAEQPVTIDVVVPTAAEPWETLDLYTWTGEAWEWVGGELHTENRDQEFLRAKVTNLPENILVVQAGTVSQKVSTSLRPDDDVTLAGGVVDEYNPSGLMLGPDGAIIGNLTQQPSTASYVVVPTLRNWAPDQQASVGILQDVLDNTVNAQDTHITSIVEMCTAQGFAGVEIDYRGVTPEYRNAFVDFITALAEAMHAKELRLTVVLQPPTNTGGVWNTNGYDWSAIGAAADAIKVSFPDDPAAYAEGGAAQQMLEWATGQVSRYKLHAQFSSLSVEQRGGETDYISLEEALAPIGTPESVNGQTQVEPDEEISFRLSGIESVRSIAPQKTAGTYRIEYQGEGNTTYTVWLGTAANLALKLQWAQRYHLGGVSITDLLDAGNAPDIVNAVAAYHSASTPEAGQEVLVHWTVTSTAALIDEEKKPLNDPDLGYTWLVMAATDTYTVKAQIAGYDQGSMPIVVAKASPIPTPAASPIIDTAGGTSCLKASFVSETVPDYTKFEQGESFTKSWTVQNSGTCDWPEGTALVKVDSSTGGPDSVPVGALAVGETVEIKVDMTAPESDGAHQSKWALQTSDTQLMEVWAVVQVGEGGGGAPAVAPVAGGGAFELGGHVRDIGMPYGDKMRYAGMNWAKVQVHYGQDATSIIQASHSQNFRIQLSALGSPTMVTQPGFENDFATWVAGMASAGADAIEVWNEPNLDREWQAGYIDPAAYTKLLCTSYNAIKAANPNTLVISAATAPTGYYGGCGPNGCDDIPFLQGMYNAGAGACMDYVGAHHNSGATSPSARSGHPADDGRNHHSWYFIPQTEKYYAIFGKQLYYTEMGYASQEGLPTFSDGWAWARGVNNAQQAAWLAEAVQLSTSTGMVRCVIVWNIDFGRYGDDPQDGYAIIRPGGSCPACDSLHNVLGSR